MLFFCEVIRVICLPCPTVYNSLISNPVICVLESEVPSSDSLSTDFDSGSVSWRHLGLSSAVQLNETRRKGKRKKGSKSGLRHCSEAREICFNGRFFCLELQYFALQFVTYWEDLESVLGDGSLHFANTKNLLSILLLWAVVLRYILSDFRVLWGRTSTKRFHSNSGLLLLYEQTTSVKNIYYIAAAF
jgi:hypothetical protein